MSQAPTAQQLFGPQPWVTDPAPGGTGPQGPYPYNPQYFATLATAVTVATIVELGCGLKPGTVKVVQKNDITSPGPYNQNQPNQMIQMPDESLHNAGLIAKEFADWPSIETINANLTQELGQPFTFVMPPKQASLMIAPIGAKATQADGTTWQRVS